MHRSLWRSLASTLTCIALASLALPRDAAAQATTSGDSIAVLAVVQGFFDAMIRQDSVKARAALAPGAQLSSVRAGGTGPVRFQSDSVFIVRIATSKQKLLERMWTPAVRVSGDIASVWTPYDFHIDGKFSHCGVDVFDLLRTSSGWKIVSVAYTVQPQGCAPSPLGPVSP